MRILNILVLSFCFKIVFFPIVERSPTVIPFSCGILSSVPISCYRPIKFDPVRWKWWPGYEFFLNFFWIIFFVVLCGCFWEEKEWYCSCRIPYTNPRKLLDVQLHLLEPLLLQNVSPFFCIGPRTWSDSRTSSRGHLVSLSKFFRSFFSSKCFILLSYAVSCLAWVLLPWTKRGKKWATGWKNRSWPV